MAKKIKTKIKLQIIGGKATPAPPVGPALGQHGLPIKDFVDKFNLATKDKTGVLLPVVITVYEDKTYDFIVKQPPVGELIKAEIKIQKGSPMPHKDKVGHLTLKNLENIAKIKFSDMNAIDMYDAMKQIAGSARAMGVTADKIPDSYQGVLPN